MFGLKGYFIETWGCQMNEEDSEKLAGMLVSMGYDRVDDYRDADIIVYNTCCVRENAELKVYGNIGKLKSLKKGKPHLTIAVCGCMMQQREVANTIVKKYPFVDIIMGTNSIQRFPELVRSAMNSTKTIVDVSDGEGEIAEGVPISRGSKISAKVTIMYGCNNFCTYCIVPYVRGRERSRRAEDILEEVHSLADQGYKEIMLLGQNVNSYGKDLKADIDFSQLLRMLNDVDGIERIRFMTSHPKDLSDDLIDAIASCDKVCKHLHLPVQSGSNRILKLMNRNYTREKYIGLISSIRDRVPEIAITTDIIVGFPGEDERDFNDTLDLVDTIKFDSAFTFLYSPRRGTPASRMEGVVDQETMHRRFNALADRLNMYSLEKNREYQGRTVKVLVEGPSKNDQSRLTGRTDTGKLVNFTAADTDIAGLIVDVMITDALTWSLDGVIV